MNIRFLEPRPADVPRLWVDPAKFQRLTGFKSRIDFETGLQETIAFYTDLMTDRNLISRVADKNWVK